MSRKRLAIITVALLVAALVVPASLASAAPRASVPTCAGDGGPAFAGAAAEIVIPNASTSVNAAGELVYTGTTGGEVVYVDGVAWSGDVRATMGGGNDGYCGGVGRDVVTGDGGADVLFGDAGDDKLLGGAGNDVLMGGAGDDKLYGQGDADVLYGNGGDDRITGKAGGDVIHGGTGDDYIKGGADDDVLYGDAENGVTAGAVLPAGAGDGATSGAAFDADWLGGDDKIAGGAGEDYIVGGLGSDTLFGGAGFDYMIGGIAAATFVVGAIDPSIAVLNAAGAYTIAVIATPVGIPPTGGNAAVTAASDAIVAGWQTGVSQGPDDLDADAVDPGIGGAAGLGPFLDLNAGIDTDADGFADVFDGGDSLKGNANDDVLQGGWGDDTLNGGDDTFTAGDGANAGDITFGGFGNDTHIGGESPANIDGDVCHELAGQGTADSCAEAETVGAPAAGAAGAGGGASAAAFGAFAAGNFETVLP